MNLIPTMAGVKKYLPNSAAGELIVSAATEVPNATDQARKDFYKRF